MICYLLNFLTFCDISGIIELSLFVSDAGSVSL